nr:hypothetical protein HmN_000822500 [Hymenolepis microstoma]CDS28510.1 hypothetical transcript [Hymenolepis microstoma]
MSKATLSTGGQLDWLLQSMTDDIKVASICSEVKQIKCSNLGNNLQLRDRVYAESMAFVAVDRDSFGGVEFKPWQQFSFEGSGGC